MTLDEWMKWARYTQGTLAQKTDLSPELIRKLRIGDRHLSIKSGPRIFWASKGKVRPEKKKIDLPDLSILPDPDDPDVTWEKDCLPALLKRKMAENAEANP